MASTNPIEFLAVYQSRVIMHRPGGVPPGGEPPIDESQKKAEGKSEVAKQESCFEGSVCLKACQELFSLEFSGCCEPYGCITFSTDGEIKYDVQAPLINLRKGK